MRILLTLLLTLFVTVSQAYLPEIPVKISQVIITAKISSTQAQMQRGLQGVRYLPFNQGMLFIYPAPQVVTYWMKDMHIPLDIFWIDANKKIIKILENLPACTYGPCPLYHSNQAVQYVLETNAGFSSREKITVGMSANF